ncbi:MAG: energy-coupling factor ABC transporter permease [Anaerolineales bacterium]|jgi:cobalt/nickel transport system permease protein
MDPIQTLFKPTALHIPDGFLNLPIALAFWALSAALLSLAIQRTRGQLSERQIPLMGVMAAFIFAAQMINFPIAGGTSGHLLGGALVAIMLGPWTGMLVMTTVIIVQALLFQDGGLLVMGANIFNMGLLSALIGYGLYQGAANRNRGVRLAVAGVAAWLSVMAGALMTALQLWLSGTSVLEFVIPAMLGVHTLIGLGEALITAAVLAFIFQTRPDLIEARSDSGSGRGWILVGVLISLAVVLISPLASASPDGLERVAINLGFIDKEVNAPYQLLPDYTLPFLGETNLSTILAGALGAAIVGILAISSILILRHSKEN